MGKLSRLWLRLRRPVLALGGGGARGFAHIGVLKALEAAGIKPKAVAGTSMGALVGAMYLVLGSADAVLEKWREAFRKELISEVPTIDVGGRKHKADNPLLQAARTIKDRIVILVTMNRATVTDGKELDSAIEFLIPDVKIEDLTRPFVAVATDLETGEEVRIRSGSLRAALRASTAIPGLVPPCELEGRVLVDGGVVAEVPVGAALELGRPVLAVDVSMELPEHREDDLIPQTMIRIQLMTSSALRRFELEKADIVVRPKVGSASWSEWQRMDEFVSAGLSAAAELLGLGSDLVKGWPQ